MAAEHSVRWGPAEPVPGFRALDSGTNHALVPGLTSLSCGQRSCAAGGSFVDRALRSRAWVAAEAGGIWRRVQAVPQWGHPNFGWSGGMTTSVSCAKSGICVAGGFYTRHGTSRAGNLVTAFLVSERNGTWSRTKRVRGLAALSQWWSSVDAVSCAPAGSCVALGHAVANDVTRMFVATQ